MKLLETAVVVGFALCASAKDVSTAHEHKAPTPTTDEVESKTTPKNPFFSTFPASMLTVDLAAQPTRYSNGTFKNTTGTGLWRDIPVATWSITAVQEPPPLALNGSVEPPNMPLLNSPMRLPAEFMWGFSTSAYQIEGAVNADGRGPSLWDYLTHKTNMTLGHATGDVAAAHYYLYKQDIQRLKALGVRALSLSISWSRIFPDGVGQVNDKGLQHYLDVVTYLREQGIEPVVSLLQNDVPMALHKEYGAFLNERIVSDFGGYAQVIFDKLADHVKYWITINDPASYCQSYAALAAQVNNEDVFPTAGIKDPLERQYKCGHNALLAHGHVAQIFKDVVKSKFGDRMITYRESFIVPHPFDAKNCNDNKAVSRSAAFNAQWLSKPVFQDGHYPDEMKQALGDLLPEFTDDQRALIMGSADYYAWDGSTGALIKAVENFDKCISDKNNSMWPACAVTRFVDVNGWAVGTEADETVPWLMDTPELFGSTVKYIWDTFKPAGGILVSGFGFAVPHENEMAAAQAIYDTPRVDYFNGYLHRLLRLVNEDGVKVVGALARTMVDDFEWQTGYVAKFGVQHVDKDMRRTFKKSAFFLQRFFGKYIGGATEPSATPQATSAPAPNTTAKERTTTVHATINDLTVTVGNTAKPAAPTNDNNAPGHRQPVQAQASAPGVVGEDVALIPKNGHVSTADDITTVVRVFLTRTKTLSTPGPTPAPAR